MRSGVLLDPKTGRPEREDIGINPEEARQSITDAVAHGRIPASVLRNLELSEQFKRASGPTATKQGFAEVLKVDIADGTQILNSTSEALVTPDYQFAANDPHIYQGASFRYTTYGDVSFVITTPGTLIFRLRLGGLAGTALATSGTYAPRTAAGVSNASYKVQYEFTVRSIGSAGSIFTMGTMLIGDVNETSATTVAANVQMFVIPPSAPAVVSSLNMTAAQLLSATAQFSVSTATTQLTNHLAILECLN